MSEYPECPICLDIYGIDQNHFKAPKILSCGDSLCKECLEEIIKRNEGNFILCPNCNEKVEKKKNIDDYIINKQLIKLVNSSFRLPGDEDKGNNKKKTIITYKIISLGTSGVGKTSIFKRLLNENFEMSYNATIYVEISVPYYVKYKNMKYKLFFYDSGGQEKFMSGLPKSYMRQSDGVLFVYDITNRKSFDDLKNWYDLYKNEKETIVGVLLGNKCDNKNDIPRQVEYNEAKLFADELELEYFETSAKNDIKIKKAIASLLEKIIESKARYESLPSINPNHEKEKFQLDPQKLKKESFCERFCQKINPKNWFS